MSDHEQRASATELAEALHLDPQLLLKISRFAQVDAPILLTGETGSGKSYLAEYVHRLSPRHQAPYRSVNLAAVTDSLSSGELFGHVAGAYTDARRGRDGLLLSARDGTVFLDELGKSSLAMQAKLLHVLETHRFRPLGSDRDVACHARFVFAASESLDELVKSGLMLPDFPPRLGLLHVAVPPLRERRDSIPRLARTIAESLRHSAAWPDTAPLHLADCLLERLVAYEWPHNVRELRALLHRLMIEAHGEPLTAELLVADLRKYCAVNSVVAAQAQPLDEQARTAVARANGNKRKAAASLGISRTTLHKRLAG